MEVIWILFFGFFRVVFGENNFRALTQIEGFNTTSIHSGPVVFIDRSTIFIPNFRFNGTQIPADLWTGIGEEFVEGKMEKLLPLENYTNGDIYVYLPTNFTLDLVNYIVVLSRNDKTNLGRISFGNLTVFGNDDPGELYLVPTCCPHNYYRENSTCVPFSNPKKTFPLNVYDSNVTHIKIDTFLNPRSYHVGTYWYFPQCLLMIELIRNDSFALLYNSSLIVNDSSVMGVLSHGMFCVNQLDDIMGTLSVGICVQDVTYVAYNAGTGSQDTIYVTLLIVSTVCFGICAITYGCVLRVKDVHRQCFTVFSMSMAFTFVSLLFLQIVNDQNACKVVGSFFVFCTIFSFSSLAVLCVVLLHVLTYLDEEIIKRRITWFLVFFFCYSLLILVLSLAINHEHLPNVPDAFVKHSFATGGASCSFEESNVYIFFVSIAAVILICFVCLGLSFVRIRENDFTRGSDYFWLQDRANYKFVFRSYVIIVFMSSFWLLECLANWMAANVVMVFVLDVIEASLGIAVFCALALNASVRNDLVAAFKQKKQIQLPTEIVNLNGDRNAVPTLDSEGEDF